MILKQPTTTKMSNNTNNQIQELQFQIELLKFQNAQLKFLCGNVVEQPVPLATARPPIVMSVAGDYVSVFEDDDNMVPHVEEPDEDDIEITSLNVYWATSFAKEKAKATTKYNKARYTASCRACPCGGKTSTINSFALRHEKTRAHQVYLMEQAYASSAYVSEGW